MKRVATKLTIGVVCAVVLWTVSGMLHFPQVFQWMFMIYVALGTAVFLLLEAPSIPLIRGTTAVVGVVVFYVITSGVFMTAGAILPQFDPADEKEKIDKLLTRQLARFAQSETTDELMRKAEELSVRANTLMARLASLEEAKGVTSVALRPQKSAAISIVDRGREVYTLYECYNCHKIGGEGGTKKRGPELGNIGSYLTPNDIIRKIISTKSDPYLYAEGFEKEHQKGLMPDKYRELMTEEELNAIAAYLSTLRNPALQTPKPIFIRSAAQHGFTVYGYVRDAQGKPVVDATVSAVPVKDESHATSVKTRKDGYYEAFIHLHNSDAGAIIRVTIEDQQKELRAEFDPNDTTTKRQATLDFTL